VTSFQNIKTHTRGVHERGEEGAGTKADKAEMIARSERGTLKN
jgi:hypothetical protein